MRSRVLLVATAVVLVCALHAGGAHADVTWLCNPDLPAPSDPCQTPLDTTDLSSTPTVTRLPSRPPADQRPVDCFYVYPTVSNQVALNATKAKDPEVVAVAKFQASRFSQGCRMFAPMYREITVAGVLGNALPATAEVAYSDVVEAWKDYLAHDNDGRGVILIGHSQGSIMLRALIHREIDPNPAERAKLVGAFLLGGNVTTKAGSDRGGDFANVPICTTRGEDGCVVAYSTSSTDPEPVNFFGNTHTDLLGAGVGLPSGNGYEVACTDPSTLSGSTSPVSLLVPTAAYPPGFISGGIAITANGPIPSAPTTWVEDFNYTGSCQTINGAHVFRYFPVGDSRRLTEFPPTWGTHLVDFNIGVEKLLSIAQQQTQTYLGGGFAVNTRTATVPGAGRVTVSAGKRLRKRAVVTTAPGSVQLRFVPTAQTVRTLRRHRHATVTARVSYAPATGPAIVRSVKVRLSRKS